MADERLASSLDSFDERQITEIIEGVEIAVAEDMAAAYSPETIERFGVVTRRIGSALVSAMTRLDVPMLNRTIGLGVREAVTDATLDAIEEVYRGAAVRYLVQIPPLTLTPELHRRLEGRGWKRCDNWANMLRTTVEPPPERTPLRIEVIGPELREPFFAVVGSAFGLPDGLEDLITPLVGRPRWRHYLAFDGETPVAAGALFCAGDVGYLTFGATLEAYRGRGGQSGIMARRIRDAGALGCRWVVTETGEDTPEHPNPSYRNMVRAGFRLAYLRPNYIYFPASAPSPQGTAD